MKQYQELGLVSKDHSTAGTPALSKPNSSMNVIGQFGLGGNNNMIGGGF